MLIYLFIILALSLFAIIEANIEEYYKEKTVKLILLPIAWLMIVGVMVLRWEIGTDWDPYFSFFDKFANWDDFNYGPPVFEKGYWVFNILIRSISDNYTIFLLILEGTLYVLLFRFFKFSTPYVLLCVLLYFGLSIGLTGANRQLLALALCLTGLKSLMEGHKLKFIGFVILAFFFHSSALLFFVFLLLNFNIPIVIIIAVIGACFIIGQTNLPFLLFSSLSGLSEHNAMKVQAYLKGAEGSLAQSQASVLGIIKKILLPTIFLMTRKRIIEKHKHYNYLLNGYLFGVAFYFLFYKSLLVMISRGSVYFNSMEPILLSLQLSVLKDKRLKNIALIMLCLFSIIFFYQSISAYPEIFIPYKSIFNK